MKVTFICLTTFVACLFLLSCSAFAGDIPIAVANASFETLPAGGLNNPCGGSCNFSTGLGIPGWDTTGYYTGQWIPGGFAGNPPAFDGSYLAYIYGAGTISQNVSSIVAGATYVLQVELLHRTDATLTGIVQITANGVVVATATGADGGAGTWNNWTATYTASAADAGKTLGILLTSDTLNNGGQQGDFDAVRLDEFTPIPEPAAMLVLIPGLVGLGYGLRRKLST